MLPAGCDAWLFTMRKNAFRKGPSAYPVPGIPCWLRPIANPVICIIMPMQGLLELGIALADYHSFLGTQAGSEFLHQQCKFVKANADETLFVPGGNLIQLVYFSMAKDAAEWSHVWHLPVMEAGWILPQSQATLAAIKSYNEPWLAAQALKNKTFADRYMVFKKLMEQLLPASPP